MASSRRVLLRLQGDSGDARRAVADVRSDLRKMSREEFQTRIDIQTARAERSLAKVNAQLENYRRQSPSAEVDLKIAKAEEKAALISLRLDRLNLKKVNIDVDIKRGGLERAAAATGTLERGVGNVVRGFGDAARAIPIFGQVFATVLNGAISAATALGSALGSLVSSGIQALSESVGALSKIGALAGPIGSVVGSLIGLAAQGALVAAIFGGLVIALNAILGAVVALAGALVALVASLTAAVAGLGALAVAFGGVLIPIVAVAIGLFTRFAAIIKARQAREQELTQSVQAQKTAEQQRKAALDASKQAHEQLAQATVDGNRAMAQSAFDLRDAELGLESSKLGVKEAALNLREAQKALREFRNQSGTGGASLDSLFQRATDVTSDPSQQRKAVGQINQQAGGKSDPLELQRRILAVQRAQLGVKESINQTAHAERTLADATQRRADFVKQGIEAYKPYRQALEQVRRSEDRVRRSQDASTAAQRKYERALKGLSNTEKTSLSNLDKFLKAFKDLAKAFTDPVFKALNDVFDTLSGKAGFLKGALTEVGKAMGDAIRAFGSFLAQPQTISAFQTMARGAAALVRVIGAKAFISFLTIMREVATKALPAVRDAAHDVATALDGVAKKPGRIRSVVGTLIGQFQAWSRLAGSLIGLVAQIFVPASKEGKNLADSMRHVVDHWRDWIRQNPGPVRQFFRDSVRKAKEIVHWLINAAKWLKNNLPAAADKAKAEFAKMLPVLRQIWNLVKLIVTDAQAISEVISDPFGTHKGNRGATFTESLPFIKKDLSLAEDPSRSRKDRIQAVQRILDRPEFKLEVDKGLDPLAKKIAQELKRVLTELGAKPKPGGVLGRISSISDKSLTAGLSTGLKTVAVKPHLAPNEPRSRTASASRVNHINITIPRPLDATKPIDPQHAAKLIQLALEDLGGTLA